MSVIPVLLREKMIIKKLLQSGAISEEAAKTLEVAGVLVINII